MTRKRVVVVMVALLALGAGNAWLAGPTSPLLAQDAGTPLAATPTPATTPVPEATPTLTVTPTLMVAERVAPGANQITNYAPMRFLRTSRRRPQKSKLYERRAV